MAYKLSKKTKVHIATMATRRKYKVLFDNRINALIASCTEQLYAKYQNDLFQGVDPVVLKACYKSDVLDLYSDDIDITNINPAMQFGSDKVKILKLQKPIYGATSRLYLHSIEDKTAYRDLLTFVKEVNGFYAALMDAMQPFKSAEKMLKALPWAEQFYPDEDKTPVCNVVPVSLIEKANELMGVTPEGKEHV